MDELPSELLETLSLMGFSREPLKDPRWEKLSNVESTAYCSDVICTGPSSPEVGGHGLTKSGVRPEAGRTVAADPKIYPLGSVLDIEGLGRRVVEDTGSAIKGPKIDIFMDTHEAAKKYGRQPRRVRNLGPLVKEAQSKALKDME